MKFAPLNSCSLFPELTECEFVVLELVSEALSNKQISGRLNVSVSTIYNQVHSILVKFQVDNRLGAAKIYWLRTGNNNKIVS